MLTIRTAISLLPMTAALANVASAQGVARPTSMVDAENRLRDLMTTPGPTVSPTQAPATQVQGALNLQRPPYPHFMRMSGVWATEAGNLELQHSTVPGYLTGTLTRRSCGGTPIPIVMAVDIDLQDGEGIWSSTFRRKDSATEALPITARLSPQGDTLEISTRGSRPTGIPDLLTGVRLTSAPDSQSQWIGAWETTLGRMIVRSEGHHLIGTIAGGNLSNGTRVSPRTIVFSGPMFGDDSSGGAWRDTSDLTVGLVRWKLTPEGKAFTGTYTRRVGSYDVEAAWVGTRLGSAPGPATSAIPDALFTRFSGAWKTQPGTMTITRSGPGATMTVADTSGKILFSSPLRASEDGLSLVGAVSGYQAMGFRPFRLSLTPDGADFNAWSLESTTKEKCSLWSGFSEARRARLGQSGGGTATPAAPAPVPARPQSLPASPEPNPPTTAPPGSGPEAPAAGLQSLGKWDVRLDRVENPRDDRLTHVYLTLRNAGTATLLQTQDVWVYLEDSSGVEQRSGQGLQPQPGYPKLFSSPPPVVRPGREIRTKFVFDRHQGAAPTRVTIEEGGAEAVYGF